MFQPVHSCGTTACSQTPEYLVYRKQNSLSQAEPEGGIPAEVPGNQYPHFAAGIERRSMVRVRC